MSAGVGVAALLVAAFLEARGAAIASASTAQQLLAEIERLTGEPLVDAPSANALENP